MTRRLSWSVEVSRRYALSPGLARWLAELGHDAVHASTIDLASAPDSVVVARARAEQRTIITADLGYPRILALAEASAPGLILFRGGNWNDAEVVAKIDALLGAVGEREIEQSILVGDEFLSVSEIDFPDSRSDELDAVRAVIARRSRSNPESSYVSWRALLAFAMTNPWRGELSG